MEISVVSPVYRAEKIVDELVFQIQQNLRQITEDYEIILVEDGSPDDSWGKILQQASLDPRVKGISLSRNFGQHHAITAGLDYAKGNWVVVMDCDLQDRPDEIKKLYEKAKQGYDIVLATRTNRQDGFLKRMSSMFFYRIFNWLSGIKQTHAIANFGVYSQQVIQSVNRMREPIRAFPPMIKWVGFKSTTLEVAHSLRYEGKSSYNWSRLINLAIDICISYSEKPLKLTVKLGLLISLFSFLFGIYNIVMYLTGHITQPGFSSLIVSIWFLSGLMIFILGIIGLYISKILDGIKGRPLYIIKESKGFE